MYDGLVVIFLQSPDVTQLVMVEIEKLKGVKGIRVARCEETGRTVLLIDLDHAYQEQLSDQIKGVVEGEKKFGKTQSFIVFE